MKGHSLLVPVFKDVMGWPSWQVLEVPGYRELADLNWLVEVADHCLEMSLDLVSISRAQVISSD